MNRNQITIGDTVVGGNAKPYVIAEAGSNFCQSLDIARRLVDAAAQAKANAVKFQLFQADILYPEKTGELYDIFKSIELNPDWVPVLKDHAEALGLHFMASAFDYVSLDRLESANVLAHKVASSETTNLQFMHRIAKTMKPIIISTGMCDMVDVEEAVGVCRSVGNKNILLMHCGALYPLPPEQANLRVIASFSGRFGCPVGFSDHTLGQTAAIASIGVGANFFEKHFTLDRSSEGPDHFYAMEPDELTNYVSALHEAHSAMGSSDKEMLSEERKVGRREGLYLKRPVKAGEIITADHLDEKRPAVGLRSRYRSTVIGASAVNDMGSDHPLTWSDIQF